MVVKNNDFVELEFTGKSNGEVFDTTDKEKAKSLGSDSEVSPLIVCVGAEMVVKGFDSALVGKEVGKSYSIHLSPGEAFGKRDPKLIKTMQIRLFHEKNINPQPGMVFQMDAYLVKVLSVSGGRVTADFNNPFCFFNADLRFLGNFFNRRNSSFHLGELPGYIS